MDNENGTPRVPDAPAEHSGQPETSKAAPIRNPEAYERSQAEKAARLASKSRDEVEALKGEIAGLKDLLSGFVGEQRAKEEARAAADKIAKREQTIQAVASKFQLPAELAKRLHGETAEELEADAAELAQLVQPPKPVAPSTTPRTIATGNVGQAPATEDRARKLADRVIRGTSGVPRYSEPYDPENYKD